jgi:hypothetical protein
MNQTNGVLMGVVLAAMFYVLWVNTRGKVALNSILNQGWSNASAIPILDPSTSVNAYQIPLVPTQLFTDFPTIDADN